MEDADLASQGAKKSRLDRDRETKGDDYQPPMPPCDAHYLVQYLNEIGPGFASGGMGPAMAEVELLAWQFNTGRRLAPWESRFMKRLSIAHAKQRQLSTKTDCPPPWDGREQRQENRAAVAARMQSLFRG